MMLRSNFDSITWWWMKWRWQSKRSLSMKTNPTSSIVKWIKLIRIGPICIIWTKIPSSAKEYSIPSIIKQLKLVKEAQNRPMILNWEVWQSDIYTLSSIKIRKAWFLLNQFMEKKKTQIVILMEILSLRKLNSKTVIAWPLPPIICSLCKFLMEIQEKNLILKPLTGTLPKINFIWERRW